ncbi:hypothetical protein B0T16DRAFT_456974 [Cercophora newfieldiana]|uniref:Uncharacterized protein n=1 Tax=Cercophora newfieldiana TaxID=92897 RepID=A0AA39YDM8_9PEZI|nr:hypothetical protein B0T16DRAFT_456974 [Cercophora newfieldiana]
MWVTRAVSLTNFLVASSALAFQVCVLYPWHKQLDDDFEKLRIEHMKVLQEKGRQSEVPHHGKDERQGKWKDMLGGIEE